uniref:Nipped-B protein n=1 Tax=Angiostrongylus cantonensis TaxID=6313 RepID=A0A0K0DK56_ANGCA
MPPAATPPSGRRRVRLPGAIATLLRTADLGNGNINMGIQGQQMGSQALGQTQYNQQMLLAQQQYMNSFNPFYGNNQHSHQQRLLEEQQRQIELARQQQQRQQQEELARQQRIKEAEEQQRQRELLAQREKEQKELLKQQEEAARIAEEKRRKEEAGRRKLEELRKIREEQLRKQQEAQQAQHDMRDRVNQVQAGQALTLVATHFNTSYTRDPALVQMVSHALSNVDVSDTRTRMDIHDGIPESNDLPRDLMPHFINAIMDVNCNALDVEPEHNMEAPEHLLNDMELDPAATAVVSTPSTAEIQQTPTEAQDKPSTSTANGDTSFIAPVLEGRDNTQLRRQMASVGKQPKASQQRKKRDQVESLYDSLTDYFDPSDGRRQRKRTKTLEEEQADQRDLELIAAMEAQSAAAVPNDVTMDHNDEQKRGDGSDEDHKFYEKRDRRRKRKEDVSDRPPTPIDIIQKRDQEWSERQRKRLEKFRRRKGNESDHECWNNDVMAEYDSKARLNIIIDQIFDQVEDLDIMNITQDGKDDDSEDDEGVSPELLIDRSVLDDLRNEVQKLLTWKKLTSISSDRLIKLITILERNMRYVDGEEYKLTQELLDDRLIRGADSACTALMIMTCHKMPKQVYIEDAIERSINLCRHYLKNVIYPASDPLYGPGRKQRSA